MFNTRDKENFKGAFSKKFLFELATIIGEIYYEGLCDSTPLFHEV